MNDQLSSKPIGGPIMRRFIRSFMCLDGEKQQSLQIDSRARAYAEMLMDAIVLREGRT